MSRFFSPRFSVRTLAIFVTLACAYFGAWEVTKKYGKESVQEPKLESDLNAFFISSPAPFLVVSDEWDPAVSRTYGNGRQPFVRRYYYWCFGLKGQLPIEANCPPSSVERFADPFL